jgi:hypothetical protein
MSQNLFATQTEESGFLGYYEGVMSNLPRLLVGKLFLTPKYIGFHTFEVRSSGLLGKARLMPTGKVVGIAMDKVVDVSVEEGVRSKKSRPNWRDPNDFERKLSGEKPFNSKPRPLDSAERYSQVMITCETEHGLEVAMFEVADAKLVTDKIRNHRAKQRI